MSLLSTPIGISIISHSFFFSLSIPFVVTFPLHHLCAVERPTIAVKPLGLPMEP